VEHDGCPTRAADGKTENASTNVVASPRREQGHRHVQNRCRGRRRASRPPARGSGRSRTGFSPTEWAVDNLAPG
jgi:hypothetical protein